MLRRIIVQLSRYSLKPLRDDGEFILYRAHAKQMESPSVLLLAEFDDQRHVCASFRSPEEKYRVRLLSIRDGFDCDDNFLGHPFPRVSEQVIPDRQYWAFKEIRNN